MQLAWELALDVESGGEPDEERDSLKLQGKGLEKYKPELLWPKYKKASVAVPYITGRLVKQGVVSTGCNAAAASIGPCIPLT